MQSTAEMVDTSVNKEELIKQLKALIRADRLQGNYKVGEIAAQIWCSGKTSEEMILAHKDSLHYLEALEEKKHSGKDYNIPEIPLVINIRETLEKAGITDIDLNDLSIWTGIQNGLNRR